MTTEVTDWISAGANVAAAVGTVGALWVGAVTLRRQVNDQRRGQAKLVTVGVTRTRTRRKSEDLFYVLNNGEEPIFGVDLLITSHKGSSASSEDVLPPKSSMSAVIESGTVTEARAQFGDSAGNGWTRFISGELFENRHWGRPRLEAPKAQSEQKNRLDQVEQKIAKIHRNAAEG
ncbi:hypothetical protein [Arthrobacter sp. 9MFCol3.1]|uniref:hypothetical protein n=1 Tax=Arthrobacter sp. 9MFCol3.1 TaxID=1150398 RepID=UPI0012DEA1CD|nr:hypothetical protein [Arthrobacter sp. 9MFCol3.1]